MLFILFLFPLLQARWTKPNIYVWLEQNSYICYLELRSPHDLRFLYKDEASTLKCSCGDPLLTQSACARSNNLRRPFCARLPDLCMKAYANIFKPSSTKKIEPRNSSIEITQNEALAYSPGTGTPKPFEFFTLAPRVEQPVVQGEQKLATPGKVFSPIKQIRSTTQSSPSPGTPTYTTSRPQTPVRGRLLDGEVTFPHDHGLEILLNNSHAMNSLMDSLIKRIAEAAKLPNSTEKPTGHEKHMIKMLSSHEEELPFQRVVFTETMREENVTGREGKLIGGRGQRRFLEAPLVLQSHGAVQTEATHPPVARTNKTKNLLKKKPIFHEALVKLQKQLLTVLGVKADEWDDEDINDNDIITIFREHMDEGTDEDLAFSDDKWSEEVGEEEQQLKALRFDPRICEDNHGFCPVWTAYRLCRSNARFMYKYCRKSCGICL